MPVHGTSLNFNKAPEQLQSLPGVGNTFIQELVDMLRSTVCDHPPFLVIIIPVYHPELES